MLTMDAAVEIHFVRRRRRRIVPMAIALMPVTCPTIGNVYKHDALIYRRWPYDKANYAD